MLAATQAGITRGHDAAPPWGALAVLAAAVLGIHALVLMSSPVRFGPELDPAPQRVRPLITRSIAPPPVVQPAAAPQPAPPRPRPKSLKPKTPPAQSSLEPFAINSVATPSLEIPVPSESPATEGAGKTSAQEAAAALVPESAASAPAAPAGPAQTPVTAVALPESVQLEYKMTSNARGLSWHATAELRWQNRGDGYDARVEASAWGLGSRSVGSTGQINAEGLSPIRYFERSRSEVAAHFEPDKGLIIFSANTPTAPWAKGAQDRISVFFQLAGMLAANPSGFPVESSISIYTVGPREADTWTFRVEKEEKLRLPLGEIDTVKLTRLPRREFDTKVEIWFAPSLGYLPVRNKITQFNGDFVDQQLNALSKN
ncbi:DUF3108 domain-containing protein [Polaromonas aquatica]|uniref:DUF3108 domain-containing protein n=1 Tax=Polaromonas aquatica TaxID=332657 RepID=UPI003D662C68